MTLSSIANCARSIITTTSKSLFSTSAKMAGNKYTLKYFNFRVLGEPIRWQFALAGVPFEDRRLARDNTWEDEFKNKNGWGRLPILVINENTEITQSTAISRYLAKLYGLMPEDDLAKARCDELVDNLQDARLGWRPFVRESDPVKKQALEKEMKENHFPFYLPRAEDFLRKYGKNGFAVGDKISWADLYLANFLQIWTDNHGKELIAPYPLLQKNMETILSIPEIKAWNLKRQVTKF